MVAIPSLVLTHYIECLFQILAKKREVLYDHFIDCSLSQLVTQSTVSGMHYIYHQK